MEGGERIVLLNRIAEVNAILSGSGVVGSLQPSFSRPRLVVLGPVRRRVFDMRWNPLLHSTPIYFLIHTLDAPCEVHTIDVIISQIRVATTRACWPAVFGFESKLL